MLDTIYSALRIALIIFGVLTVFNFMILIHEWGHFLAARWRGLRVDKFYIWFGKPIWKRTYNGVEYGLGSLPFGGFVALPQMAPQGGLEGDDGDKRESLPPISAMDKIIVAFAGPLFSFMLAVAFAMLVSWLGVPRGMEFTSTIVGMVEKDSPADKQGIKVGDRIVSIDGTPVKHFVGPLDSVTWSVVSSEGETVDVVVERGGQTLPPFKLQPILTEAEPGILSFLFKRPALRRVGLGPAIAPMVGEVSANGPAAQAGLLANDVVSAVNGQPLYSLGQLGEYIETNPGKPLQLSILRDEKPIELTMQPRPADSWTGTWADAAEKATEEAKLRVGIVWDGTGKRDLAYPSVKEQVVDAMRSMKQMIQKVAFSNSNIGVSHMSGMVGIARVYYNLFEQPNALLWIFSFSVMLNINLAIMNMLPFPVLDGGHITMGLWELITRRVPKGTILELVQQGCVMLLLGFMAWVTLKDVGDLFGKGGKQSEGPRPVFLAK
jgi:regulator of sigma E protease